MKQSATITFPVPLAPESLQCIETTIQEIRAIRNMNHKAWLEQYVTPEGRKAIEQWERIRAKCSDAKTLAEKQVPRFQPTEADGLPHEYAVLLAAQAEAETAYHGWDKPFQSLSILAHEPDHLGFERTSSQGSNLSRLAEMARKETLAGREIASTALEDIKHKIEPKEREGTIVRRVRQHCYTAYSMRESIAGDAAYEKAMQKRGGHAAEKAAKAARQAADDAQQADINKLGKRLELELQAYLLEAPLPSVKLVCPERVTGSGGKDQQCGAECDSKKELSDHLFHRHGRGTEREETVERIWHEAMGQREG
jgi:hypothetical protein